MQTFGLSSVRRLAHLLRHRGLASLLLSTHESLARGDGASFLGSVSERELEVLRRLVGVAAGYPGPIVEIGTLFGLTTQLIAMAKEPDRKLITVDNYSWNPFQLPARSHQRFTRGALRFCTERCNVELFDGSNVAFYAQYRGERPAMVFIDADHSYEGIVVDLAWARRMQIPVICGHDYAPRCPGVMRAVDEAFGARKQIDETIWSSVP